MKKRIFPIVIAVFAAVFCFFVFMHFACKNRDVRDFKELNEITETASGFINNALAYADIMELSIQFQDGVYSEKMFMDLTDMAIRQNPTIDSIQLAKDYTVTYINPISGNWSAIGHNLMEDPKRREYLTRAIESRRMVTQGPVHSIQGKNMIFGRKPIFVNGEYWGLAIVAIDYDKLIQSVKLGMDDSLNFAISVYESSDPDKLSFIWGDEEIVEKSKIFAELKMPGQRWRVSILHKTTVATMHTAILVGAVISVLAGLLMFVLFSILAGKLYLSKIDPLTKTCNRIEFKRSAEKFLKARRVCAFLSIDLDKFKYINDTFGHLVGDEILINAAVRMKNSVRKGDLISRVGGDEYLIFLTDVKSHQQLFSIIERIRETTEQQLQVGEHHVTVGVSIGYAIFPHEAETYKDLYEIADKRMYKDKNRRRKLGEPDTTTSSAAKA